MTRPQRNRFDIAQARRRLAASSGKRFWTSLEEIVDADDFREWVEAEFPSAAPILTAAGRRQFLKLMGASLLLAGLSACGEDRADIALPYVNQPEEMVPGVPRFYATAVPFEGYVQHAGRPTKLDGNPELPASGGASDAFTQAAVLQLRGGEHRLSRPVQGAGTRWRASNLGRVSTRSPRHARGLDRTPRRGPAHPDRRRHLADAHSPARAAFRACVGGRHPDNDPG